MFPKVPGHPDYSSTGVNQFIPAIWSGKLVANLYDATVLAAITNTDYEGEIKAHGDKVIIRTIPVTSVKPYIKGQNLVYDRPESPSLELLIDQPFCLGNFIQRGFPAFKFRPQLIQLPLLLNAHP